MESKLHKDPSRSRQPGVASISHPYPPTYNHRTRPSEPPSESYAYDRTRRNHSSFSDAPNPYDPRPPGISITHAASDSPPAKGAAGSVKVGKGKYAGGWTAEDEAAEKVFLQKGMFDWKKMKDWRFWFRLSWWYWYLILIIVCVLVGLMTIYNDQIVEWMTPFANKLKTLPAGFTIPVALLFILSFPPLFGAEIIILLVGVVWGLWVGFAIVTVGTMLGEVGNFYAFKYCLRGQAVKLEETNPNYACLAHIVREGGFFLAFVIRLSAVPGHFSTAVFATCGMNIFVFCAATILTMPKQLVIVYLGVIFVSNGEKDPKQQIITYTTLAVAAGRSSPCGADIVLTIWSAWYIWAKMNKARTIIWRRERIAEKQAAPQGLNVSGAQVNRRVSYREMLDQPNDDIEALSPMLPKDNYMREAYNTPYELQQVPLQNKSPVVPDFSRPPSYSSPILPPSRRDSGTLPQANGRRTQNGSTYDIDGPEVRENRIDFSYGYNPSESLERFPEPKPLPEDAISPSKVNRVSMYDPSAEEGYGERRADVESGRRAESASRGYQLSDAAYPR